MLGVAESGVNKERGVGGCPLVGDALDGLEPTAEGGANGVIVVRFEESSSLKVFEKKENILAVKLFTCQD